MRRGTEEDMAGGGGLGCDRKMVKEGGQEDTMWKVTKRARLRYEVRGKTERRNSRKRKD